jgi:hypothetical protein
MPNANSFNIYFRFREFFMKYTAISTAGWTLSVWLGYEAALLGIYAIVLESAHSDEKWVMVISCLWLTGRQHDPNACAALILDHPLLQKHMQQRYLQSLCFTILWRLWNHLYGNTHSIMNLITTHFHTRLIITFWSLRLWRRRQHVSAKPQDKLILPRLIVQNTIVWATLTKIALKFKTH